ncbi:MAG TPA: FlgD immunoglobulin-like domain containing protein, partial [Candidatus Saccharimonadales bacterium]|nr:FlgD immunoglobulin-like domain containing protein [Candidatus Saccharimonadales bacterium]
MRRPASRAAWTLVPALLLLGFAGARPAPARAALPAAEPPRFLSSGGRSAYAEGWAAAHGIPLPARPAAAPEELPAGLAPASVLAPQAGPSLFTNVRVNDPAGDVSSETQSETTGASWGSRVIAGFNDSRGFTTGTISSYGYSTDGGATWTDGGDLPLQGLGTGEQLYGDPGVFANRQGHFWFSSIYIQPGNISAIGVQRATFSGPAPAWGPPVAVNPSLPDFLDKPGGACDPDSDYVYVVYTRFLGGVGWGQMEFARSLDGGAHWDPAVVLQPEIAGDNVQGGWIVVDDQHAVHVFWEDGLGRPLGTGQHAYLLHRRSGDFGATFSATDTVAPIHANWYAGPPGFNRLDGFFEFPNGAVDRSAGPARGTLYVAWNESAEPVWSGVPPTPQPEAEPNDLVTQADSVGWPVRISGTISSTSDVDCFRFSGAAGQMVRLLVTPSPALYPWLRLSDSPGGDTLLINSRVAAGIPAEGWVTLPATGTYTALVRSFNSTTGSYTLDVEGVTAAPGSAALDHRDAVVAVSPDRGAHWRAPVRLNDDPPQFDQCMPMVTVDSLGLAHAFWYDRRNDPARGGRADLYYARSSDGGLTWSPNLRVTDQATTWQVASRAAPNFGDYSTATSSGNAVWPLWADGRSGNPDVFTAAVRSGFGLGCPGDTSVARHDTLSLAYAVTNLSPFPETFGYDISDSLGCFAAAHDSVAVGPLGAAQVVYRRPVPDSLSADRDDPVQLTGRYRSAAFAVAVCRSVAHLSRGVVAVGDPGLETRLERPGPSPTRGEVRLRFSLARDGAVRIGIYDVAGRRVAQPAAGVWPAGRHEVRWAGRAEGGAPVASGVYLIRAELGGSAQT